MRDAILAKIEKCKAAWRALGNVCSREPDDQSPAHEQWDGLQSKIGREWSDAFWDMITDIG